jgi:hypothetical protein
MMRIWLALMILASMLLALAACGSQVPAGTSGSDMPQIFSSTQYQEDTRSGALPERLSDNADIDPDSLRLLGMRYSHAFYAARDNTGDICLLNVIDTPGVEKPTIGIGCTPPERFARAGEFVVVNTPQDYASAVFLPDGYTEDVRDMFPDAFVRDNLLAFTRDAAIDEAIDTYGDRVLLSSDSGDELSFSLAALR